MFSRLTLLLLLTAVVSITSEYEQYEDCGADDEAHVEISEDGEEFNQDSTGYDDENFQAEFHDRIENYARTKRQSRLLNSGQQNGFFGGPRNFLTLVWQFLRRSIQSISPPLSTSEFFEFLREGYPLPEGRKEPYDEYDFVIIGSGSAGSVLASRLSEEGRWRILVLEAGAGESIVTDPPLQAASLMLTDYNWGYRPERVEGVCMAMEEQRCHWPRGKAVGGSSVINYMIYSRGDRLDFDRWAEAGNPGWSYDEVFPYFYKAEMANLPGLENSPNHNTNGHLSVEYVAYKSPVMAAFLKAARLFGHRIDDYNQGDQNSFSRLQATTLRGRRHTSAHAYLKANKQRPNLDILIRSRVVKINIDKFTKTAKSVEYIRNKRRYTVYAKKEIILSAGTIGSAHLLMLSGVGPRKHLTEMNIPVIQDLPVGQTMYDHLSFYGLIFRVNRTDISPFETRVLRPRYFTEWWNKGQGPFTLIGGLEGIGFIKTKISEEPTNLPDMELLFAPAGITADASQTIRKGMKITDEFFSEVYGDVVEKDSFSIIPMILRPKSKGVLKLKDKNPFHWPSLYYDYFSDTRDLDTFVESIKYVLRMVETEPFQKFGAKLHDRHFPTCRQFQFGTDEYWGCAVRTLSTSIHHQTATCKMGQAYNPEAVVSPDLKVHGIDRLRVIDASVVPNAMGSHFNAVAIMIGEKGADMLKQEWGWYL